MMTIESYKTHLITRGFTYEYGINYEKTFDPLAKITFI